RQVVRARSVSEGTPRSRFGLGRKTDEDAIMPNTVSGTVFDDKDGDGTQGPNEPSLPGVNLRVVDLNAGGAVLATATTDAGGNYSIDASGFTSTSCELQVVPPFDFIGVYLFDWDPTAQNGPIVANFGLLRIECRYVV